ncbi:3-oxoacyl-[acyl-carrier-protein] synthase 2 [Streptomyces xanthochromogenes]|uniref:beta-ketoacyl-[acyl-carrier-protein] synthase family protein n=1 Tax=Streptomyces xanthochromogenes TaxID=67384 RepID=UPI0019B2F429|nr:beta-ketoacyl-[acyl-carrier-protein] synthase family protein [Streptomyces xanthochromogenes]GHB63372.1 3-oxoacyl-[acyl-carrier-protein] synthase 2 [Streptomyces xanthochromogenes]
MSEESVMGGKCLLLTTGELVPGDVIATDPDGPWLVVVRTAPATETKTRLHLRPLTGGPDVERVMPRYERQVVRTTRVDPAALPDPAQWAVPRRRRVVVTGLGAVSPLGADVPELWQGLLEGRCGVSVMEGPGFDGLPVRLAARAAVDPAELLPRPLARRMNRSSQLALVAAREAWRDAGLDPGGTVAGGLRPTRTGVSMGTIIGGAPVMVESRLALIARGPRAVSPHTTPMTVPSASAAQVSKDLDIRGEARTFVSACASGTEAIGQAVDAIRSGRLDLVVAGGTEAVITPEILAAFAAMRAVSRRNDQPEHASRPFDDARDGFVLGEGAGVLVLEDEEHARARGARIYCEAAGWGLSADAFHMAAPEPHGRGIEAALRSALADAGATPDDVAHVNAHATATVEGDRTEALALGRLFGSQIRDIPVTANKGALGHLQGGAGGVEAIASVLTLRDGLIPPTVGCDHPEEGLGLDIVRDTPRPLPPCGDLVLSDSFGFGGHNAVLALRRL